MTPTEDQIEAMKRRARRECRENGISEHSTTNADRKVPSEMSPTEWEALKAKVMATEPDPTYPSLRTARTYIDLIRANAQALHCVLTNREDKVIDLDDSGRRKLVDQVLVLLLVGDRMAADACAMEHGVIDGCTSVPVKDDGSEF